MHAASCGNKSLPSFSPSRQTLDASFLLFAATTLIHFTYDTTCACFAFLFSVSAIANPKKGNFVRPAQEKYLFVWEYTVIRGGILRRSTIFYLRYKQAKSRLSSRIM
jgi:hypothetical protein